MATGIAVSDLEKATAFYVEVLGLKKLQAVDLDEMKEHLWQCRRLGIGEATLDLGELVQTGGTLEATVGIGSLVVVVPDGLHLRIHAQSDIGQVVLFGSVVEGGEEVGRACVLDGTRATTHTRRARPRSRSTATRRSSVR